MLGYEKPADIYAWGADLLHTLQPVWLLLTLLIIYERLNILKNNLVLMAMYSYNLHLAQPEEDWPPLRAWFL